MSSIQTDLDTTQIDVDGFDRDFARFFATNYAKSRSQLGQDLLALFVLGDAPGVFLDIGAADPISISNTKLLEDCGWDGVLVEPNPTYGEAIRRERRATLVAKAITPDMSGYAELDLIDDDPEFSRLGGHDLWDQHDLSGKRANARKITVETISVSDLAQLAKSRFGKVDFISLDIEGLEYSVLEMFPFSQLRPVVLCVEHNHADAEKNITALLTGKGYVRVGQRYSKWDAWFVAEEALRRAFRSDRQIGAPPVEAFLRGQNFIEIARSLYDSFDFKAVISLVEARRSEARIGYTGAALLARSYNHEGFVSECIDTCRDAVRALRASGEEQLAEKHILPIADNASKRLNMLRTAQSLKFLGPSIQELKDIADLAKMRDALSEPHTLEANRLYVMRVCNERNSAVRPHNMPAANDFEGRARLAFEGYCRLSGIRRVEKAGTTESGRFGDVQWMFNGVKVPADAYYGPWMTRLIEACEGHHEPQEEQVFDALLKTLPNASTMIELGSYWAFYTSWFLSEKGSLAKATIVEPDPRNLGAGLETLRLNNLTASVHLGCIGTDDKLSAIQLGSEGGSYKAPIFDMNKYIDTLGVPVDILHADIQGAEDVLLSDISQRLQKGLVKNLVISTHGMRKHLKVLKMLSDLGFYIVCDVDPYESYSYDGLIVARHPSVPVLGYIDTPRWDGSLSASPHLSVRPPEIRPFVLLENTIAAGAHPKREIFNALTTLGLDVCVFGEKLKGNFYIPYKPYDLADVDLAIDSSLVSLTYKGINIWHVCRGNVGYDLPSFNFETASEEERLQVKKLFIRAIKFVDLFEQIIANHRPAAAVVWGGMFIEPAIIAILCKRHDIPVFATEFSFDPNRIHFDASGRIGNDFSFSQKWLESRASDLTIEQRKKIKAWVAENYRGKSKSQPVNALSDNVLNFIRSTDSKPLLLLGQCFVDTVITFDNPHFNDAEEAYFAVIDVCVRNGIPLIVKSHPGDRENYKLRLREKCAHHELTYYVGLESDENVYHLMDVCAGGITINSQSGLEMLVKGKPVLNLGRSFYGEAGLSSVLHGPEKLEEMVLSLVRRAGSEPQGDVRSEKYLYQLLFEHLVDLDESHDAICRQIAERLMKQSPKLLSGSGLHKEGTERSKLRIVILHASPSWGGSGFYMQDLAMQFQRLGHEVVVLAEGTCAPHDRGVRWRTLTFEGSLLSPQLRDELRDFNPNVIFEAGVRSKPMRAALELSIAHKSLLIVHGEDDEFVPFQKHYPGADLEILNELDKEIVTPEDLVTMFQKISLPQLAHVFADPYFDRWVDPLLRSILYHRADRFTAIWKPMLDRLETRFGTTGDLLPPIVHFADYDLGPLSDETRKRLLAELDLAESSLIYFVNGTIYSYSDEYRIFVSALEMLQQKTDKPIALLILGDPGTEEGLKIQFRRLGRLGTEAYMQYIKLADVICAPGVPDTFNRYRLSSRLVKGMMLSKPIFTFKTGFAESLEDDVDGFFTHTSSPEEWCEVLQRTLSAEARAFAGKRGSVLASEWFDAAKTASRLAKSWATMLEEPVINKPIISGVLSKTKTFSTLQGIYERRVPYSLRRHASTQLRQNEIRHDRFNQWSLLLYGFSQLPVDSVTTRPRYYANRSFSAFAVSPNRTSDRIRVFFRIDGKACNVGSEILVWSHAGKIDAQKYIKHEKLVVEFESPFSDFLIYKPAWYRGPNKEKVFFEVLDIEVEPRAGFDAPYARSVEQATKDQIAGERLRIEKKAARERWKTQLVKSVVQQYERGEYKKAEDFLKELVNAYPSNTAYLRAMAEAQFRDGRRTMAVSTLNEAHKLAKNKGPIKRRIREMSRLWVLRQFLKNQPYPIRSIEKNAP